MLAVLIMGLVCISLVAREVGKQTPGYGPSGGLGCEVSVQVCGPFPCSAVVSLSYVEKLFPYGGSGP